MYAFGGGEPGTTVLIFTVNPDAGKSSPPTFHPEAVYEIKLDTDGDAVEDAAFRVTFGGPDTDGAQGFAVSRAEGVALRDPGARKASCSARVVPGRRSPSPAAVGPGRGSPPTRSSATA